MAQPPVLPRYANVSGAVTEPSEGKKDVGWTVAEKPAAQYFNWLHKLTYDWLNYLKTLNTEAFSWTAAHDWIKGLLVNPDTAGVAWIRSSQLTATNSWNLVAEGLTADSGSVKARVYMGYNGQICQTINARWNHSDSKWYADDTGTFAGRLRLANGNLYQEQKLTVAAAWSELTWQVPDATNQWQNKFELDTLHYIGSGGGEPAYQNNWGTLTTAQKLCYRKLPNGNIRAEGWIINTGDGAFTTVTTLPAGYRPPALCSFPQTAVQNSGAVIPCEVQVASSGNIDVLKYNTPTMTDIKKVKIVLEFDPRIATA